MLCFSNVIPEKINVERQRNLWLMVIEVHSATCFVPVQGNKLWKGLTNKEDCVLVTS